MGDRRRVLVIDDEPSVVGLFQQLLTQEGYEVDIAGSGEEGLEIFARKGHEVVLTDLRLGDMTGLDVLKMVKRGKPSTAVVILTGYTSLESAMEALRLGANDYLSKPARSMDLLKSVRNQMAAVELAEQVQALNQAVAEERDKLRRSVAELTLLKGLAERMMTVLSYAGGFEVILNLLVEEVAADVAVIYFLDDRTARLAASSEVSRRDLKQLSEVIEHRASKLLGMELVCTPDNFAGVPPGAETAEGDGIRPGLGGFVSTIAVPLRQGERAIGLLLAASRANDGFEAEWGEFITQLATSGSEFLQRIKRSVEAQRHFTAAVVEHTLDGIIAISPQSGDVLINPVARSLLELPSGESPTGEQVTLWLNLDLKGIWAELKNADSDDPSQRTKSVRIDRIVNGQKFFLRLSISLLPGQEGQDDMLLIVLHDDTQERAVEEMKNRLISNITHEVRTPTAVIKEFMSLIMDGVAGELTDAQRQYIQIMHNNIERLARLIDNLLTLARSDTGGFAIVLRPIELRPIINEVANSMDVKLKRKRMRLNVQLPDELPLIYADADAVTQVITNLVDNAFKYSAEDTEVTIEARAEGSRVVISVADQGYGIPREDQEKIFRRFHRLVDEHDPRFREGVGLGLSLVKDFVTRHGGEVWVKSAPGEGSTFYFSLQVAEVDKEHQPA
jgi:signal transduction histidine kinase/DNA-binding response OmpR family regulator